MDSALAVNDSAWLYAQSGVWQGGAGNYSNDTALLDNEVPELVPMIITAVILGVIILATVVGKCFLNSLIAYASFS